MSNQSWPEFLDYLDSDSERAFKEFYLFSQKFFDERLPKIMRHIDPERLPDLIEDIKYHCVKNNFRSLKRYQDTGRPFVAWLHVVSHNRTLDYLRHSGIEPETTSLESDQEGSGLANLLPNPGPGTEQQAVAREYLDQTRQAIKLLGNYCQLLLELAADEFTPKEIVGALRLPKGDNKKVSDDLRECRKKLKARMSEFGVRLADLGLT